jgi:hypothetical protein
MVALASTSGAVIATDDAGDSHTKVLSLTVLHALATTSTVTSTTTSTAPPREPPIFECTTTTSTTLHPCAHGTKCQEVDCRAVRLA